MKKVTQLHDTGCGLACVAMATNKGYLQIYKQGLSLGIFDRENPDEDLGTTYADTRRLLAENGFKTVSKQKVRSWKQVKGKTAIVAVKFRKKDNGFHWVYYKDGNVYDPSPLAKYHRPDLRSLKISGYIEIK